LPAKADGKSRPDRRWILTMVGSRDRRGLSTHQVSDVFSSRMAAPRSRQCWAWPRWQLNGSAACESSKGRHWEVGASKWQRAVVKLWGALVSGRSTHPAKPVLRTLGAEAGTRGRPCGRRLKAAVFANKQPWRCRTARAGSKLVRMASWLRSLNSLRLFPCGQRFRRLTI